MAAHVSAGLAVFLLAAVVWSAKPVAQSSNVTLREAVQEIRDAVAHINPEFEREEWELSRDLAAALLRLEVSGVLDVSVRHLLEPPSVDFLSSAKRRQYTFDSADTFSGLPELLYTWNVVRTVRNRNAGAKGLPAGQPRGILKRLQDDVTLNNTTIDEMFVAYNDVDALFRGRALRQAIERLRRYERKFGPGSVQLNVIEVGIAYMLQGVRGFGYHPDEGPGPLEVVASYSTTYFSYADEDVQIVSGAEFGLRYYYFGDDWGRGGLRGYLKPGHVSAGVVVAGAKDGPLVGPWSGESRVGVFGAWGDLKVAWIGGANSRWLLTKQFQILPFIF